MHVSIISQSMCLSVSDGWCKIYGISLAAYVYSDSNTSAYLSWNLLYRPKHFSGWMLAQNIRNNKFMVRAQPNAEPSPECTSAQLVRSALCLHRICPNSAGLLQLTCGPVLAQPPTMPLAEKSRRPLRSEPYSEIQLQRADGNAVARRHRSDSLEASAKAL